MSFSDDMNQVGQSGVPLDEDMGAYDHNDTGLPMNVIILGRGGEKHGPRVKFQQDYSAKLHYDGAVSVTIGDDPGVPRGQVWKLSAKDFEQARKFILLNKDLLLRYYRHEILTRELESGLKKV